MDDDLIILDGEKEKKKFKLPTIKLPKIRIKKVDDPKPKEKKKISLLNYDVIHEFHRILKFLVPYLLIGLLYVVLTK